MAGEVVGAVNHINNDDRENLRIELLGDEAVKTSQIEGELLDRSSVQFSLRRHFGLVADKRSVRPQERGIADMMIDLYKTYSDPLDHETLFRWHAMLMSGNREIAAIGSYRTHADRIRSY